MAEELIKRGMKIDSKDTVGVVLEEVKAGETVRCGDTTVTVRQDTSMPHKIALVDIKKGESLYKYGEVIGYATENIRKGDHVHIHNLDSEKIMEQ